MGTTVLYKKLLDLLGHEVIMPPRPTRKTFDLGVKYSPEFACYPLKVITGTYIEALNKGAEFLVTSGGHGPCRAGFYHEVHQRILYNLGYKNEIIVFDALKENFYGVLKSFFRIKSGNSFSKIKKSLKFCYKMAESLDNIEKVVTTKRAYEINKGDFTAAWKKIQEMYDKEVYIIEDIDKVEKKSYELINLIKVKSVSEHERIRIGVVGEIYVVMEPSVNMEIEENLNNLGVEVERSHFLSDWIEFNLTRNRKKCHEYRILKKGDPWLEINIGGHAKQSLGHIVNFNDRGFDGVIQLMPFGCLPELVAQSIIPKMSKELGIPILSLSIDEQTGNANVQTRLEAFLDLVKSIKNEKLKKNNIICLDNVVDQNVLDYKTKEGIL
jgi:predicted nucleotide-binding protein (sugar kinase/HSP70/actin superfamily)